MTIIIEESDNVPLELLKAILDSVRMDNKVMILIHNDSILYLYLLFYQMVSSPPSNFHLLHGSWGRVSLKNPRTNSSLILEKH